MIKIKLYIKQRRFVLQGIIAVESQNNIQCKTTCQDLPTG